MKLIANLLGTINSQLRLHDVRWEEIDLENSNTHVIEHSNAHQELNAKAFRV